YYGILNFERTKVSLPDRGVVRLGYKKLAKQKEFLRQLLITLLAKIGRHDDKNTAFSLGPLLGNDQASLDSLAQADFIRDQRPLGEWRIEGEQRRIDLMRIQIHLRPGDRPPPASPSCPTNNAW